MTDRLVKGLAFNDQIRVMAVDATNTVEEAHQRHDTWSNASAALGRTLTGALLLASGMDTEDHLTVRISGNGPLGGITVSADGHGNVKGYVEHPHVSLPLNDFGKIDVFGAVGNQGTLSVTKDMGMAEPFTGQVPLISGEIAEDFTYYLAQSEQIPSAVALGTLVDTDEHILQAGGWVIQVLPFADDEVIERVEKAVKETAQVTKLLEDGLDPKAMIIKLLGEENVRFLADYPVQFHCDCNKERFASGLHALPSEQLTPLIEEDHGAEIVCQFCGKTYTFTEAELQAIQASK
ncbi:MAG: Hsp33 family molecular chaperone HslO [Aerococcus sp.]|nr:Hsp33 family molecular chaperone HslO [Aerococcus sp.]